MCYSVKVIEAIKSMLVRGIEDSSKQLDEWPLDKWERQHGFIEGRIQEMKDTLDYVQEIESIWSSQ